MPSQTSATLDWMQARSVRWVRWGGRWAGPPAAGQGLGGLLAPSLPEGGLIFKMFDFESNLESLLSSVVVARFSVAEPGFIVWSRSRLFMLNIFFSKKLLRLVMKTFCVKSRMLGFEPKTLRPWSHAVRTPDSKIVRQNKKTDHFLFLLVEYFEAAVFQ